jgi:hypothetical protein
MWGGAIPARAEMWPAATGQHRRCGRRGDRRERGRGRRCGQRGDWRERGRGRRRAGRPGSGRWGSDGQRENGARVKMKRRAGPGPC